MRASPVVHYQRDSQNLETDASLQRTSVSIFPDSLHLVSHWPHCVVEEVDLENVKAVPSRQIHS